MSNSFKTYRINKAGIYCIGHFRSVEGIRLHFGCPNTCGCIDLDDEKTIELLNVLKVDWEDGGFLQDLLEGQIVSVGINDETGKIVSIGDPFGNKVVLLKDGDTNE